MIKDQVLSINQCKELIKLGLDMSDASICYSPNGVLQLLSQYNSPDGLWKDYKGAYHKIQCMEKDGLSPYCYEGEYIPTYTLDDVLGKLPSQIYFEDWGDSAVLTIRSYDKSNWAVSYNIFEARCIEYEDEFLINATYKMLKWCLENKYLQIK